MAAVEAAAFAVEDRAEIVGAVPDALGGGAFDADAPRTPLDERLSPVGPG